MIRVVAALLVAAALLAGCSTPPGPEPASPGPKLPANAIAYDDLKSTNRPFPFSGNCSQLDSGVIARLGFVRASDIESFTGGCSLHADRPKLDMLWIEPKFPPNKSEARYFPLMWNGTLVSGPYLRRLILDQRYYATEHIGFDGNAPGCYLTVDTGSPFAIQFRGILPDTAAGTYGELNPAQTNYQVDRAGVDRFMAENCPLVEQLATELLKVIDPHGGSLATS